MKQLLILCFLLYELRSDCKLERVEMINKSHICDREQILKVWPGTMDTCVTNVFCPNGKRRLFY